jgi:hypothetical protein
MHSDPNHVTRIRGVVRKCLGGVVRAGDGRRYMQRGKSGYD